MRRALALALLTASCSGGEQSREGANAAEATAPAGIPRDAAVTPSGHLTILEAPLPAPFATLNDENPSRARLADRTPELVHPAVPPTLRRFIRAFPQAKKPNGDVLDLGSEHAIVLRDGCFFLDRNGDQDPLVHLPLHVGLTVDQDGYLAFRSRHEGQEDNVRVGLQAQTGWFHGTLSSAAGHRGTMRGPDDGRRNHRVGPLCSA